MGMVKCKECTHYLTCRQGNSNQDYCGLFMNYENTVEVVRCKDCKHFDRLFKGDGVVNKIGTCYLRAEEGVEIATVCDGFCHYGERKEK